MNRDTKIKILQQNLDKEEQRIKSLFKAGRIPGKADYTELNRIKKELKIQRIIMTKETKRKDPILSKTIGIRVTQEEYDNLSDQAAAAGANLSEYLRKRVLKKVEE